MRFAGAIIREVNGRSLAAILAVVSCAVASRSTALEVRPGGVVRWRGEGLSACSAAGRSWAPADATCFFPVDLLARGTLRLQRTRLGRVETAAVTVGPYPYPEQRLEVDDRKVHLSPADQERAAREAAEVAALWPLEGEARFALPLAAPLAELPKGGRFGSRRVFNGEPRAPHGGADYPAVVGTPVLAAADGRVALAEDQFFGGNSVYVDHGGGLISTYMHLSRIDVKLGEQVKRGQRIGAVGATGRVTGPHLHFALRWHGARVDPALLLGAVADLPELASPATTDH
jgi:murein DD-endopeptidase MepM/ murein hydrolase activator NlpD